MKRVLVVGYYQHSNIGDDVFEYVWKNVFCIPNVCDIDQLVNVETVNMDVLVVGAGDLINDYFLQQIWNFVYRVKYTGPIYAIGVGIPYPQMISEGKLKPFDVVLHRDFTISQFERFPDLAYFLPAQKNIASLPPSKIGVFLTRTVYDPQNPARYTKWLEQIAKFLIPILKKTSHHQLPCPGTHPTFQVELYPCCSSDNDAEDDRIINRDLYHMLSQYDNIQLHEATLHPSSVLDIFAQFRFTIVQRYHAHLFSIFTQTPFLSINTTQKVAALLKEYSYEYSVQPSLTSDLYPLDFPSTQAVQQFSQLKLHRDIVSQQLATTYQSIRSGITAFHDRIESLISEPVQTFSDDSPAFQILLRSYLDKITPYTDHPRFGEIISYFITGSHDSEYLYGLQQQMPLKNLKESVKWILQDLRSKNKLRPASKLVQFQIHGIHRSGWSYVMDHLSKMSFPVKVDTYLDRTFGWEYDFLSALQEIPYQEDWIGFFHHTPSLLVENNLPKTLNQPLFRASLNKCKGIVVLSQYLKNYLQTKLPAAVPIHVLKHPTLMPKLTFSPQKFKKNPDPSVVQIGAWMRNTYAIYALKTNYTKKALKGKSMDNYYPYDHFLPQIQQFFQQLGKPGELDICRCRFGNQYLSGLYNNIEMEYQTVELIDHLSDDEYDVLLSENVVFVNLIDASAVNTVIECIVRNTPILINRLPAVVEYLGENYPLYYHSLEEAESLLTPRMIRKGWNYLRHLDKTEFQIETFCKKMKKIISLIKKN